MIMKTRLQADFVYHTYLVTPTRTEPPGGMQLFNRLQQEWKENSENGCSFTSFSDRDVLDFRYSISGCKNLRYKTCARFSLHSYFHPAVTGNRQYF